MTAGVDIYGGSCPIPLVNQKPKRQCPELGIVYLSVLTAPLSRDVVNPQLWMVPENQVQLLHRKELHQRLVHTANSVETGSLHFHSRYCRFICPTEMAFSK